MLLVAPLVFAGASGQEGATAGGVLCSASLARCILVATRATTQFQVRLHACAEIFLVALLLVLLAHVLIHTALTHTCASCMR